MKETPTYTSTVDKDLTGDALQKLMKDVVERGSLFRFRANGTSMSPFIQDGDIVTIERLDKGSFRIGDVFAYIETYNDRLVIHRLVRKTKNSLYFKGDNTEAPGNNILYSQIIGRVSSVECDGKAITFGFGPERILVAWLTSAKRDERFKRLMIKTLLSIFRRISR